MMGDRCGNSENGKLGGRETTTGCTSRYGRKRLSVEG